MDWEAFRFYCLAAVFVGSQQHKDAVDRLPGHDFSKEYVDLQVDGIPVLVWPIDARSRASVIWRSDPPPSDSDGTAGKFFKILRFDGFDADYFRSVYDAYTTLETKRADAHDPPPPSLPDAQLWYGAGELCILTPWVCGRDAQQDDLCDGGHAVLPVAEAIAWLARHGLLYIDLRAPNVRVSPDLTVTLVDMDDLVCVEPPNSYAALATLLREHDAKYALSEDCPGALPAIMTALAQMRY